MSDDMKKCPKCGNECRVGDLYCLKCRYKFGSEDSDKLDRMKRVDDYTKNNLKEDTEAENQDHNKTFDSQQTNDDNYSSDSMKDDETFLDQETVQFLEQKDLDMYYVLNITSEEAKSGCKKVEIFQFAETCSYCNGLGKTFSTKNPNCPDCNGRGFITKTTQTILGSFTSTIACPKCQETNNLVENTCPKCTDGFNRYNKQLSFTIPANTKNGQVLRIKNEGLLDSENNMGDVCVKINIVNNKNPNWWIILLIVWIIYKIIRLFFI